MIFLWRKTVLHLFRSHWQSAAIQMYWQVYHVKSKRFCLGLLSMARWAFQCNCEPGFDEHKCQHWMSLQSFSIFRTFLYNKHENRRGSVEKVAITKGFGWTRFWQLTCDLKCPWWSWLGNLRFPLHRNSHCWWPLSSGLSDCSEAIMLCSDLIVHLLRGILVNSLIALSNDPFFRMKQKISQ